MRHFLNQVMNGTPRGLMDLIAIVVLVAFVLCAVWYLRRSHTRPSTSRRGRQPDG